MRHGLGSGVRSRDTLRPGGSRSLWALRYLHMYEFIDRLDNNRFIDTFSGGARIRTPLTRALSHCGSPPRQNQRQDSAPQRCPHRKFPNRNLPLFSTTLHPLQASSTHPIFKGSPPTNDPPTATFCDSAPLLPYIFERQGNVVRGYCRAGWLLFRRLVHPGLCPARAWRRVRGGR